MQPYDTAIDFGSSNIKFTDNIILESIGFVLDWLRTPAIWVIDWYLQEITDYIVQEIIVPEVFQHGYVRLPTTAYGELSTLVLDFTLPKNPLYNFRSLDVFYDGSIFVEEEGQHLTVPQQALTFQESDAYDFEAVTTAFSANSIIQAVTKTGIVSIPIEYNLFQSILGFDITTQFFGKIIPQLNATFGNKNVTIVSKVLNATHVHWNKENEETQLHAATLTNFYIVNENLTQQLAFSALLNLDLNVTINVAADKSVSLNVEEMDLTSFTVVEDNCNAKADEAGIERRVNDLMGTIQESINYLLPFYGIKLPSFANFDYAVSLDY